MYSLRYLHDDEAVTSAVHKLRHQAARAGVDPAARARLLVEVYESARLIVAGGKPVRLCTEIRQDEAAGPEHLVVTVEPVAGLPAEPQTFWRLPIHDRQAAEATPADEGTALAHEELRELFGRLDTAGAELSKVREELAETNRGIVTFAAELAERDARLSRANRAIFRDLEDALRPPRPSMDRLQIALHHAPAEDDSPTGGDLYDFLVLSNDEIQVVVVDVAGHGVSATRDALNIIYTIRALTLEGHPLGALVSRTAAILEPAFSDLVGTVLIARLDLRTGRLVVATGGHPPPLIVPPAGDAAYAEIAGSGIGYPYPGSDLLDERVLAPGTLVLLYSDGLVEATRDLDAGLARLAELGAALRDRPVAELTEKIVATMRQKVLHSDDTLLIALRWTP